MQTFQERTRSVGVQSVVQVAVCDAASQTAVQAAPVGDVAVSKSIIFGSQTVPYNGVSWDERGELGQH